MQVLGLQNDAPYIRLAFVDVKRKKAEIRALKAVPSLSIKDVKELYISHWRGEIAAGTSSLVRILDLPITSQKQIELGLSYQIESLTHYPLNELVYDTTISIGKASSDVSVFFLPKSSLTSQLEEWKKYSVEPDFVTSLSSALIEYAKFRCPDLDSGFLVHLGSNEWLCVWMEKGEIRKSFAIPFGVETLLTALWEDRKKVLFQKEIEGVAKQIDLQQLKKQLNPNLSEKLEEARRTLAGVLLSFQQAAGPRPVLLTGRLDAFGRLGEYLLHDSPELPIYEHPSPISAEEFKCALSIGIALSASPQNKHQIQFLKGEFIPRKSWRKTGAWIIALALLSLSSSIAMAHTGYRSVQSKKIAMADSLKKLTESKLIRSNQSKNIDQVIEQSVAAIEKYDKELPYILQAPTVSEVLSWMSQNPTKKLFDAESDSFEVLDLRYQLVSYPKIGSLKENYKARIELQFKVPSIMIARKFHESLLQNDDIVDLSDEVSWESLSDSYRTSFTLKNRTPHVP